MAEVKLRNGDLIIIGERNIAPVDYIFDCDENCLFIVSDTQGHEVFCCLLSDLLYFRLLDCGDPY